MSWKEANVVLIGENRSFGANGDSLFTDRHIQKVMCDRQVVTQVLRKWETDIDVLYRVRGSLPPKTPSYSSVLTAIDKK